MQQIAAYHEKVIDHYENPRNVGSLDKSDPSVGTGIVGAPACGDVMKLQIKVTRLINLRDVKVVESRNKKSTKCSSILEFRAKQ